MVPALFSYAPWVKSQSEDEGWSTAKGGRWAAAGPPGYWYGNGHSVKGHVFQNYGGKVPSITASEARALGESLQKAGDVGAATKYLDMAKHLEAAAKPVVISDHVRMQQAHSTARKLEKQMEQQLGRQSEMRTQPMSLNLEELVAGTVDFSKLIDCSHMLEDLTTDNDVGASDLEQFQKRKEDLSSRVTKLARDLFAQ
ncbi:unnamed protein product, partial [Prorocentrum cordatum]